MSDPNIQPEHPLAFLGTDRRKQALLVGGAALVILAVAWSTVSWWRGRHASPNAPATNEAQMAQEESQEPAVDENGKPLSAEEKARRDQERAAREMATMQQVDQQIHQTSIQTMNETQRTLKTIQDINQINRLNQQLQQQMRVQQQKQK